ncbi:MAG: ATP-dependent helicase, partial [Candidatus Aphodousia sp.]|nr:ATP-dependent helicase [Candidatus Aphodousia sp.]
MSGLSLRDQLSGLRQLSIEKARREQDEREKMKATRKITAAKTVESSSVQEKPKNELPSGVKPYLKPASGLPVSERADEIIKAIRDNRVLILCGETGSGKTTQLPKLCALAGRGRRGMIAHTQPRRIAASSIAKRLAEETRTELGQWVGFKVRFTDKTERTAKVKMMTDGILLAETQGDPLLRSYDTIIIDEA